MSLSDRILSVIVKDGVRATTREIADLIGVCAVDDGLLDALDALESEGKIRGQPLGTTEWIWSRPDVGRVEP